MMARLAGVSHGAFGPKACPRDGYLRVRIWTENAIALGRVSNEGRVFLNT